MVRIMDTSDFNYLRKGKNWGRLEFSKNLYDIDVGDKFMRRCDGFYFYAGLNNSYVVFDIILEESSVAYLLSRNKDKIMLRIHFLDGLPSGIEIGQMYFDVEYYE